MRSLTLFDRIVTLTFIPFILYGQNTAVPLQTNVTTGGPSLQVPIKPEGPRLAPIQNDKVLEGQAVNPIDEEQTAKSAQVQENTPITREIQTAKTETLDPKVQRIKRLIPSRSVVLPIDPALPDDFQAESESKADHLLDGIYWGTPQALNKFFINHSDITDMIIRVKLSPEVVQEGPETFVGEKSLDKELKFSRQTEVNVRKVLWGRFPVLVVDTRDKNGVVAYNAWVGLNVPEGWTLRFTLMMPKDTLEVPDRLLSQWNDFLDNTKELPQKSYYQALNENMQEGYTIFGVDNARVKTIAQRRMGDNKLLIVVSPLNDQTKFKLQRYLESFLDSNEHKPIVKVYGQIDYKDEETTLEIKSVVDVLVKDVQEFSVDYKLLQKDPHLSVIFTDSTPQKKKEESLK